MFKAFLRVFLIAGFAVGLSGTASADTRHQGVAFGDSLFAGYQLPPEAAFPAQLEAALRDAGHDVTIANAAVSGDTTSGGLSRLDWSVPDGTDFVILELGANDALRGLSPQITRENLDAMIARLTERDIDVILVGMLAPPNMGDDYAEAFNPIFADLAEKYGLPFHPFILDGVIGDPAKLLGDRMHPNGTGVAEMVRRFLPVMQEYLDGLAG